MTSIRIGSRGSDLALWQARHIKSRLEEQGTEVEIRIIKTKGDRLQHLSFDKIEGKGFFTKEIEDALLANEIDLAVHSMKDLPTTAPEGLIITALSYRENPADWLVIRRERTAAKKLFRLPEGAIVGTSSARRKAQLLHYRPDLQWKDIRGNVPTRLGKLREGQFDAIILAAAGLTRLETDLTEFTVIRFNPREFVPAPAQGVLALQTRTDDLETRRALKAIHNPEVARRTNVERRILQLFDGGCHLPLGVYCEKDPLGHYHVWAAMGSEPGAPVTYVQLSQSTTDGLAERVYEKLQNG